jgi:hypothetical protein
MPPQMASEVGCWFSRFSGGSCIALASHRTTACSAMQQCICQGSSSIALHCAWCVGRQIDDADSSSVGAAARRNKCSRGVAWVHEQELDSSAPRHVHYDRSVGLLSSGNCSGS